MTPYPPSYSNLTTSNMIATTLPHPHHNSHPSLLHSHWVIAGVRAAVIGVTTTGLSWIYLTNQLEANTLDFLRLCECVLGGRPFDSYHMSHWNNNHTHTCSHMHITCKQTCKSHHTHKCLHNTHIFLTHFQLVIMHQTRTNAHADTHCSLVKKRPLMKECLLTTFGAISCI